MDLPSNETGLTSQYENHEVRITALEKAVVDLHHDIALLRQHMDCGFESLRAEIAHTADKLRLEFQESQQQLYEKIKLEFKSADEQTTVRIDRLEAKIDRLEAKLDYFIKWIVGMQLTTMGGLIALAAHQYL
ncbi:hypothetical protein [Massilia sp. BJB1822]|uniref:hypothetical protein n=1 Tax=Massilia sp. BJB1822 TaxID=2744470 RepID=UPI0015934CA3|nr:hypothetical protein [Massilia sp. BJB1822]NVD98673.1 hypothetical protein [Massilia sp. BJB1822]